MEKRTASVMSNAMATSMREERFSLVSEIAPMTVYDAQYKGVLLSAPA
jgi:hypothetical protein